MGARPIVIVVSVKHQPTRRRDIRARARRARGSCAAVVALALIASAPAAPAQSVTCRSGKTVYAERGVRVFQMSSRNMRPGERRQVFRVCRPGSGRPLVLYVSATLTSVTFKPAERQGGRVLYLIDEIGGGSDFGSYEIGWFSVRTGTIRRALLGQELTRGDGSVSATVTARAVAPDGGLAIVMSYEGDSAGKDVPEVTVQEVAYMRPGRRPRVLAQPKVLKTLPTGSIVPASLRVRDGVVTWTTKSGTSGRAPIDGT